MLGGRLGEQRARVRATSGSPSSSRAVLDRIGQRPWPAAARVRLEQVGYDSAEYAQARQSLPPPGLFVREVVPAGNRCSGR